MEEPLTRKPEDDNDEPPIIPPTKTSTRAFPFGVASGDVKSGVISAIVTIAILALMVMAGGVGLVTKNDFTANLASFGVASEQAQADLAAISGQVQADVAKAKNDVALAIQGVSGTITSTVNTAVSQATGLWNSQLSALGDKDNVLASNFQANADSIVALDTKQANDVIALNDDIDALNEEISELIAEVLALEAKDADYEARIKLLETPVSSASSVPFSIESRIVSKTISYDAVAGNSTITFGVKLVLTNNEARDLEDIELEVPIEVYVGVRTGTGEILIWHDLVSKWYLGDIDTGFGGYVGEAYGILTGTDIMLDGSDVEKITVSMRMVVRGEVSVFDVDIDDDDIDVVDWGYE